MTYNSELTAIPEIKGGEDEESSWPGLNEPLTNPGYSHEMFPSSKPIIRCGKYGMKLPSMGLSTGHWDEFNGDLSQHIQSILNRSLDQLSSVMVVANHTTDKVKLCLSDAVGELINHPNLRNLILVPCQPLDNVNDWIQESKSECDWINLPFQPHHILNPNPAPLLLITPDKKKQFHFRNIVTRLYRSITKVINSGRAAHVGISGFRLGIIMELQRQLLNGNYPGLSAIQVEFSLMNRYAETTSLIKYCQINNIVVLASQVIPTTLTTKMDPTNIDLSSEIYQTLKFKSQPVNDSLQMMSKSMKQIADTRHLAWEVIAINYVMMKGLIPIIEPRDTEHLDQSRQAMGWRLTSNEMVNLNQVTLPITFSSPKTFNKNQAKPSQIKTKNPITSTLCYLASPTAAAAAKLIPPKPSSPLTSQRDTLNKSPLLGPMSPKVKIVMSPILGSANHQLSITIEGGPMSFDNHWKSEINIEINKDSIQGNLLNEITIEPANENPMKPANEITMKPANENPMKPANENPMKPANENPIEPTNNPGLGFETPPASPSQLDPFQFNFPMPPPIRNWDTIATPFPIRNLSPPVTNLPPVQDRILDLLTESTTDSNSPFLDTSDSSLITQPNTYPRPHPVYPSHTLNFPPNTTSSSLFESNPSSIQPPELLFAQEFSSTPITISTNTSV